MIIFLPIKLALTGGTSSFAQKLQAGMATSGHQVIFTYQPNYDILLASPDAPWRYLWDAWRRRKPIIHRLDGVYYPTTTAGWRYRFYNASLGLLHRYVAHATIYQSYYSQACVKIFLGTSLAPHTIIYNGIDTARFNPAGEMMALRDNPTQQVFITASRFRRSDQIMPLLESFTEYRQHHQSNSKLVIIGNFTGAVQHIPATYQSQPGVIFTGIVSNNKLPEYLRAADVFVFSHLNPPCPNNVIEALACGLPICGVADGAMPELVRSGHEGELLPVASDGFYHACPVDSQSFAAQMAHIIKKRAHYASAARQRAMRQFTLEHMITQYLAFIKSL